MTCTFPHDELGSLVRPIERAAVSNGLGVMGVKPSRARLLGYKAAGLDRCSHTSRGTRAGGRHPKVMNMNSIRSLAGVLLVLSLVQISWQVPLLQAGDSSRFEEDDTLEGESRELSNMKRHSEGTFANDYSKFLEDRKAQDFVRWLMSNKRSGATDKRHADGTFTSDVSSYLSDQAIKDFVAKLKSGQVRRESLTARERQELIRRHVDGSFTSDVNKVLDSLAAKEYLLWVMTSKPPGESKKRQMEQH